MPQIFPTWMTSPFFMYGVPGLILLYFFMLLITRNWRGLRRALVMLVVVILLGATLFSGYLKYLFKDFVWQFPPAEIIAQTVTMHPFDDRIEAIGTTEANESTALTSNVSETVKEILFTEGQFVKTGTMIARLHDDEEQANLVEAKKAYTRSSELAKTNAVSAARVDSDRARLSIVMAQVNDRQITAPFDGILGLRSISVGDIVNPGTVITTLDDVDPIKLEFAVPEGFMATMTAGLPVEARADAYNGQVFRGVISAVDPRIDPVTRTLRVKAEIPNEDGKLRAGMLMSVEVVRNVRENVAVSEEALVSTGTKKTVRVIGAPDAEGFSVIEDRAVTIGARRPGYVEILNGLQVGEKVAVDGVIKANPDAKVKIIGEKTIDDTMGIAAGQAVSGKQDDLKTLGIESHELPPAVTGNEPVVAPTTEETGTSVPSPDTGTTTEMPPAPVIPDANMPLPAPVSGDTDASPPQVPAPGLEMPHPEGAAPADQSATPLGSE